MKSCLEDYFELKLGCVLPWRASDYSSSSDNSSSIRTCSSKEDLQRYHDAVMGISITSSEDIYKTTGCYYSCAYTKYSLQLMTENTFTNFTVENRGFRWDLIRFSPPKNKSS